MNFRRKLLGAFGTGVFAKGLTYGLTAHAQPAQRVRRIGFLTLGSAESNAHYLVAFRVGMAALKWTDGRDYVIEARYAEVSRADEIEAALARMAQDGAQALVVFASPLFTNERRRIAQLALARRWAMIGSVYGYAEEGALLSYGNNPDTNFRRAAYYVDRILKGAKPADLPIEQPTTIELVINGKTAKALGITLPQSLRIRADRVIE